MRDFKPNFEKSYSNANEILLVLDEANGFPYSVIDVAQEIVGIPCITYKKVLRFGSDIKDFGSNSAVIIEYHGRTGLFYNSENSKEHIRFSILHELGHFINKHKYEYASEEIYGIQEVEANYFAAQLLMPEQIINEFIRRGKQISVDFLMETFGVSNQAAQKRRETLNKIQNFKRTEDEKMYDDIILQKNIAFIDSIASEKNAIDWAERDYEMETERNNW